MLNLHLIPFHFFAHGLLNMGTGWMHRSFTPFHMLSRLL